MKSVMRKIFTINKKRVFFYLCLVLVFFLVKCGLTALTVEIPKSGKANEVATFMLHGGAEPRIASGTYTTKLLVGFLVPKSWHAAENTKVSFTSPKGNAVMSVIPSGEREGASGLSWPDAAKKRFGIGPNLVDDMEWVVYRSNATYTFGNNEDIKFDVKIESKLGSQNMLVKLGFFLGSSIENLRPDDTDYTKYTYSDTFQVTDGEGDLIDFVNPPMSKVMPIKSLDNDIITLTFDAGVLTTELDGTDDIYLCARGITLNDETLPVCEQTVKTKLTPIGGKKYRIDFWPRSFFNVAKGKTLKKVEYYYTNATGTIKVGNSNTTLPFTYAFECD